MNKINSYKIITERLIIESPNETHAGQFLEYRLKNKKIFKPWSPQFSSDYYTLNNITKEMRKFSIMFEKEQLFKFFLFNKKNTNTIIGDFSFSNIVKGVFLSCHLGYHIDQDYSNKGLMREALSAGINYFFNEKKYHRIEANVIPENKPSIKLLLTLGFEEEGLAKKYLKINNKWEDHTHFTLLNENIE